MIRCAYTGYWKCSLIGYNLVHWQNTNTKFRSQTWVCSNHRNWNSCNTKSGWKQNKGYSTICVETRDCIYRSVPLIRPPILYTTSSLKWGEGLYSNMQLVSNISPPPPPPKFYATATYISKVHVYIRTQLEKHIGTTSEKSCQFNARSITYTTTSL